MLVSTIRNDTTTSQEITDLERRLQGHVEGLARPRHFTAQPRANRQTREQIADLLRRFGYRVETQGIYRNLVGIPPWWNLGSAGLLPAVCAHYDSVPATPGADDNASGLAVMLEVARLAAGHQIPIVVIAFNAEEDDLAGSRDFVDQTGLRLEVAHVLEMVGFTAPVQRLPRVPRWLLGDVPETGDFIGVAADRRSGRHLKRVLAAARACPAAAPVVGLRLFFGSELWLPDIVRSDHAPFWRAGLPALLWTDTAELRNPNYHLPTDTPDTLDYEFMARVALLLLRSVEQNRDVT